MLKDFLKPFSTASDYVAYHRAKHSRIMSRVFFSFGSAFGLMLGVLYLAGNDYKIPFGFIALPIVSFIYGCIMLALSSRMINSQIARAEAHKFNKWNELVASRSTTTIDNTKQ